MARNRASKRIAGEDKLADAIPELVAELMGHQAADGTTLATDETPTNWGQVGGWTLAGVGLPVTIVGLGLVVLGLIPLIGHTAAKSDLEGLATDGNLSDLDTARQLQETQSFYGGLWAPWGGVSLAAGVVVAVVAAVATGTGAALVVSGDGGLGDRDEGESE